MLHRLHDGRLVLEDFLGLIRETRLVNDLEGRLLARLSVLDHQYHSVATITKKVTYAKQLSEAI